MADDKDKLVRTADEIMTYMIKDINHISNMCLWGIEGRQNH